MKKVELNSFLEERSKIGGQQVFYDEEGTMHGQVLHHDQIEACVCNSIILQIALAEELVILEDSLFNDPDIRLHSVQVEHYIHRHEDLALFQSQILGLYRVAIPIRNGNEKGTVLGFSTTGCFEEVRTVMRNLYRQKRLDELVLHFMSFENDISTFPKFESYLLEETDCPGAEPIDGIETYPFMAELICNVQERGEMFFPTNRFSVEDLEKDAYIQALIKSGYWVCAVTYGDCGYITVRVGKK